MPELATDEAEIRKDNQWMHTPLRQQLKEEAKVSGYGSLYYAFTTIGLSPELARREGLRASAAGTPPAGTHAARACARGHRTRGMLLPLLACAGCCGAVHKMCCVLLPHLCAWQAAGGGPDTVVLPAVEALIRVAAIDTLRSNFLEPLQGAAIATTGGDGQLGRIHCSLNINTETGRLSCRRPKPAEPACWGQGHLQGMARLRRQGKLWRLHPADVPAALIQQGWCRLPCGGPRGCRQSVPVLPAQCACVRCMCALR